MRARAGELGPAPVRAGGRRLRAQAGAVLAVGGRDPRAAGKAVVARLGRPGAAWPPHTHPGSPDSGGSLSATHLSRDRTSAYCRGENLRSILRQARARMRVTASLRTPAARSVGRIGSRCPSDAAIIQPGSCPRGRDAGIPRARRAADLRSPSQHGCRLAGHDAAPDRRARPDRRRAARPGSAPAVLAGTGPGSRARADRRGPCGGQHAISELDVAIRDIRDMVFDSCRAGWPAAGTPC
jgi:hypothetical protein